MELPGLPGLRAPLSLTAKADLISAGARARGPVGAGPALPPGPRAQEQLDSQGPSRAGAEPYAACNGKELAVPTQQGHLDLCASGTCGLFPWGGCSVRSRALTSACLLKKERSPLFSSLMEEGPVRTEAGVQVGQASSMISHIFLGGNSCLGQGDGRYCCKASSDTAWQASGRDLV